jgi:hypothetical protein
MLGHASIVLTADTWPVRTWKARCRSVVSCSVRRRWLSSSVRKVERSGTTWPCRTGPSYLREYRSPYPMWTHIGIGRFAVEAARSR